MATDELLTVGEAAEFLGIRPWTLRHWISERKIDFVKYGNGVVRIKRSTLDHFVARCTIKANSHERQPQSPRLRGGTGVGAPHQPVVG